MSTRRCSLAQHLQMTTPYSDPSPGCCLRLAISCFALAMMSLWFICFTVGLYRPLSVRARMRSRSCLSCVDGVEGWEEHGVREGERNTDRHQEPGGVSVEGGMDRWQERWVWEGDDGSFKGAVQHHHPRHLCLAAFSQVQLRASPATPPDSRYT